jgi:hypothetical protein
VGLHEGSGGVKFQSPMKYLGGHPGREKATTCTVTIDDDGVRARVVRNFIDVPWSEVRAVEVDGPDEVQRRVTATRLLATGLFAFAFKKAKRLAYLTITTDDGEAIFETDDFTPQELQAKVSWTATRLSSSGP